MPPPPSAETMIYDGCGDRRERSVPKIWTTNLGPVLLLCLASAAVVQLLLPGNVPMAGPVQASGHRPVSDNRGPTPELPGPPGGIMVHPTVPSETPDSALGYVHDHTLQSTTVWAGMQGTATMPSMPEGHHQTLQRTQLHEWIDGGLHPLPYDDDRSDIHVPPVHIRLDIGSEAVQGSGLFISKILDVFWICNLGLHSFHSYGTTLLMILTAAATEIRAVRIPDDLLTEYVSSNPDFDFEEEPNFTDGMDPIKCENTGTVSFRPANRCPQSVETGLTSTACRAEMTELKAQTECTNWEAALSGVETCAASVKSAEQFLRLCSEVMADEQDRNCTRASSLEGDSVDVGSVVSPLLDARRFQNVAMLTSEGLKSKVTLHTSAGRRDLLETKLSTPFGFIGKGHWCNKHIYTGMKRSDVTRFYRVMVTQGLVTVAENGVDISGVTSERLPIAAGSCKKTLTPVVIKWKVTDHEELSQVDIPPWAGYWKVTESREDERDFLNYVAVVYLKLMTEENKMLFRQGRVYDYALLPRDSCGCSVRDLCFLRAGKLHRVGHSLTKTDRAEASLALQARFSTTELATTHKILSFTHGVYTDFGIFFAEHAYPGRKRVLNLISTVVNDGLKVARTRNGSMSLQGQTELTSYVPGKNTGKLQFRLESGIAVHQPKAPKTEVLRTQVGHATINNCMERYNDGTEEGFVEMSRCLRGTDQTITILFAVAMTLLSILTLISIIHLICCFVSKRRNGSYYFGTFVVVVRYLFPPSYKYGMDVEKLMLEESSKITKEVYLDMRQYVVTRGLTQFICTVISHMPVMILPYLTLCTAVYITKMAWTILTWPLALITGRKLISAFSINSWGAFTYGPPSVISGGGVSALKVDECHLIRFSKRQGAIASANVTLVALCSFIIASGVLFGTASAQDGAGQAMSFVATCDDSTCHSNLWISGSLPMSEGYDHSHPLIEKTSGETIGLVKISVSQAEYSVPLQHEFSAPTFTAHESNLICKWDDPERSYNAFSFWHACTDCNEHDCDSWGKRGSSVISSDKDSAQRQPVEGFSIDPKGYWWGASSETDGFQFSSVRAEIDINQRGYRQFSSLSSKLEGHITLTVTIRGEDMIHTTMALNELLDTKTLAPDYGSIRVYPVREVGWSPDGLSINCHYESLKGNRSPSCRVISKQWADDRALNIFAEPHSSNEGVVNYNGLRFKITGNVGSRGKELTYIERLQTSPNYYSSAPTVGTATGCTTKITHKSPRLTEPTFTCSDRRWKTEADCANQKAAWGSSQGSKVDGKMSLTSCTGIRLHYSIHLKIEYDSSSSLADSVDLSGMTIEMDGCYGGTQKARFSVHTAESESGGVMVSSSQRTTMCPNMVLLSPSSRDFNCTVGTKEVKILVSSPDQKNQREFSFELTQACESFSFDQGCVDCNPDLPPNDVTGLSWWEWALVAVGCGFLIVLLGLCLLTCLPAIVSDTFRQRSTARQDTLPIYVERPPERFAESSSSLRERVKPSAEG